MKTWHFLTLTLLAIVALPESALFAAPVMPALPNNSWLFDEVLPAEDGYGAVPYTGTQRIYGDWFEPNDSVNVANPQLVQTGTTLAGVAGAVSNGTPFSYDGNQSMLSDWRQSGSAIFGTRTYGRLENYSVGASGSIAFWYNPVRHVGTGEAYFFSFANSVTGEILTARALPSHTAASGTVANMQNYNGWPEVYNAAATIDTAFSYGSAENGALGETWYHMAFTWSPGDSIRVYKNGVEIAQGLGDVQPFEANLISFGGFPSGFNQAPGLYDELAPWDTAISADNVAWLYEHSLSTIPVPEPASMGLMLSSFLAVAAVRRRRQRVSACDN